MILHYAVIASFGSGLKLDGGNRARFLLFLHVALNTENAIIHYCGPVNCKGRVIVESWDNCEQ